MAIPGTKPKAAGQARNRAKPTHDWTEVENVPFVGGPRLPAKMSNGLPWPAWTKRWWGVVSTMPHCRLWSASDWEFALDTAVLKAVFHMQGAAAMATEIRNREKVLGTTADYRRDLRIRYVDADTEAPSDANVTHLDDFRAL